MSKAKKAKGSKFPIKKKKIPVKAIIKKKPVKKAAAVKAVVKKKAVKKAVQVKKQVQKKRSPKPVSAKAAAKRKTVKKAVKKASVPKIIITWTSIKKPVPVKRSSVKKSIIAKSVAKKPVVKKALPAAKTVVKKNVVVKKIAVQKAKPLIPPPEILVPATVTIPDEIVSKAANIAPSDEKEQWPVSDELKITDTVVDPLTATDQHEYAKATTKNDPHRKMHSLEPGKTKRPAGKKTFWRK